MYIIYLYGNRTMKCVEIILSRGTRVQENDGEDESDQGTM
jgi:hypothetical protein